jgi:hypothetical protein
MMDGKLHHRARDFTGQTFGALRAIQPSHADGKKTHWLFVCTCGKQVVKVGADVTKEVKRGGTPNCGCLTSLLISRGNTRHGMSKHPAFAVWRSMLDRCRLPSHQAWKNYGGRGITVCVRWRESFENFWADMGSTYRQGLTLDRRDNEKGYTPENCSWRTYFAQANNRRGNVLLSTPWGTLTVQQASERAGIKRTTLAYRVSKGWAQEELFAITKRSTTS